ncbi:glycosyltransferase family 9 protein [Sphaerotilaceae bacterium SBD11-9]
MAMIWDGLRRYGEETWQPPFPQTLPDTSVQYAREHSAWKAARRRAARELNMRLHGQGPLVRERIDPQQHRRLLWIHQGTPQVGDSLMDLAARVLLDGRVGSVDLLTNAHLLPLYQHDRVFRRVGATPAELAGEAYDLVLLHSTSSRSTRDKFAHYRRLPFVHIQGYYTGPEFNRTLFGFYRLAQLLGVEVGNDTLLRMARPSMSVSEAHRAAVAQLDIPADAWLIALGGVRDWRTYNRWPDVLREMRRVGIEVPIVLVGSDNGLPWRDQILSAATGLRIIDRVARHSLPETQALISRCALALCADGGLLHVAHTTEVPVVALFAADIQPELRLTPANRTVALYGPASVSDIDPAEIVSRARRAVAV